MQIKRKKKLLKIFNFYLLIREATMRDVCKNYVDHERVSFATIEDKLKNLQNSTLPPPGRKWNLYTVQLEPVTPPSVHNITVRSLYHQSTCNHESKKNPNQGYGPRRGVKSKMFSVLGKWTQL